MINLDKEIESKLDIHRTLNLQMAESLDIINKIIIKSEKRLSFCNKNLKASMGGRHDGCYIRWDRGIERLYFFDGIKECLLISAPFEIRLECRAILIGLVYLCNDIIDKQIKLGENKS